MIPVLYSPTETAFTSQGLGTLNDVISCTVTEKRNGSFELQMEYGVEGIHYSDLAHSCQILAKPNEGMDPQPFRIYRISKPLNGKVTVYAEHISYQLSHIPVSTFTENGISAVFAMLPQKVLENCPFTFWTDKTSTGTFKVEQPSSVRSLLGGQKGSILDVYGGEYQFDGYTVKLYNERGHDNGATLRYGKNITDLTQEESITNTVTGICPYWKNSQSNTVIMCDPPVIYAPNANAYPYKRTACVDFTSDFQDAPSQAALRAAAENYITNNNIGVPTVNLKVSFVALWQTEEYKNIIGVERINLCDTITVEFPPLGVSAKAKVISTTYDVLLDRYSSIEIGEAKSDLAGTVSNIVSGIETEVTETKTFMQQAIDHATELITGGLGGYVVTVQNADGQPQELLILGDSPDYTQAQQVWRWNRNGLGYSSTGYSGTYTTAITKDGHIVADFIDVGNLTANIITTGTMSADRIQGGTLSLGGYNDASGVLTMKNSSGTVYGSWDSSGLTIGSNFSVSSAGHLTASSADITGTITSISGTQKTILDSSTLSGYRNNVLYGQLSLSGVSKYIDGQTSTWAELSSTGQLFLGGGSFIFLEKNNGASISIENGIEFRTSNGFSVEINNTGFHVYSNYSGGEYFWIDQNGLLRAINTQHYHDVYTGWITAGNVTFYVEKGLILDNISSGGSGDDQIVIPD